MLVFQIYKDYDLLEVFVKVNEENLVVAYSSFSNGCLCTYTNSVLSGEDLLNDLAFGTPELKNFTMSKCFKRWLLKTMNSFIWND